MEGMKRMRNPRVLYVCLAVLWATGLAALLVLPNPAPIHWNAAGEVDGYGSPLLAALLAPAIVTALAVLAPLLPRIDPRGERYAAFAGTYRRFMGAIALFLTLVHLVTLSGALGLPVPVATTVTVGVGLLLAALGNELGRVQPNYFVGIRTPWTLADPEVWRRTHRLGGRAFVALGVAIALAPLLLPGPAVVAVVLAGSIGLVVLLFGYSYWAWRHPRSADSSPGPSAR
jgi:uncharacterized membrane protein